eukprot:SAG11_NODE_55_length_19449_cov_28.630135_17_plen_527_part_00
MPAFVLTEGHEREYATLGYTVFQQILPATLISELREACDELRDEARRQTGPQAQRLTKILDTNVDPAPFRKYAELPDIQAAFAALIVPGARHGTHMFWTEEQADYHAGHGVMIEPSARPYCTVWHRDWRDNVFGLDLGEWDQVCTDSRYFNQINLPLYTDSSFWVVPGSHLRRDTAQETDLFPDRPIKLPHHMAAEQPEEPAAVAEARCLAYMRSMPGAVQLHLQAGDLCIYRNCLWHAGCYTTTAKRATLHDVPDTPEFQAWRTGRFRRSEAALAVERDGGPRAMMNPREQPAGASYCSPPEFDVRRRVAVGSMRAEVCTNKDTPRAMQSLPSAEKSIAQMTQAQKFFFDLNGWLCIPAVLSPKECAALRAETFEAATTQNPAMRNTNERKYPNGYYNSLSHSGLASELLDHPAIAGILHELLSDGEIPDIGQDHWSFRCEDLMTCIRQPGWSADQQTPNPHGMGGQRANGQGYQARGGRIFSGPTRVVGELSEVQHGKGGTWFLSGSHKANFVWPQSVREPLGQ